LPVGSRPAQTTLTPLSWLRRHPLLGQFALTYGTSWDGIRAVFDATRFDLTGLRPLDTV
jgi:hypothetical protein